MSRKCPAVDRSYEGWYNVREETFVTETEAQASEFKDPASAVPLRKMPRHFVDTSSTLPRTPSRACRCRRCRSRPTRSR